MGQLARLRCRLQCAVDSEPNIALVLMQASLGWVRRVESRVFEFGFRGQDRLASRIVNLFEINNGPRSFGSLDAVVHVSISPVRHDELWRFAIK